MTISARLLRGASAAVVHAFVPCMCKVTASSMVIAMADELAARRNLADSEARASDGVRAPGFDASNLRGPQS